MALVQRNYSSSSGANGWQAFRSEAPGPTETAMVHYAYYPTAGEAQKAIRRCFPGISIRFQREDQAGGIEAYVGYGNWVT